MTTKPTYTPALRFPDFLNDGEWEVKRLGEICIVNPPSKDIPNEFNYLDLESVVAGRIISCNRIKREGAPSRAQRLVQKYDVLFQMVRPYQQNNLYFLLEDGQYVASTGYAVLRAKEGVSDSGYLYHIVHSKDFLSQVLQRCTGSNYPAINSSSLEDICVPFPPLPEQRRIAQALTALDELIAATNEKLEQMKAYKKGLMQQLFVDSTGGGKSLKINYLQIPKLRFPAFYQEKEWEEKKLGEVGYTYTGLSGKDKNDFGHGDAEYITYLNVFSNPIIKQEMNLPIEIDNKQHSVQYGDVFFTTSSETPDEVGMSSVWLENKDNVYLNSFCFGYRLTEEFDYRYLSYYFRSDSFRKRMVVLAQGISRYNISKIKAMELPIQYPTIPEQRKIASCLSAMDETINAYTEKATLLGQYKKGLMQRMFPKQ